MRIFHLLPLIAALLPPTAAFVDCRIACRRCRDNKGHPVLLEVHCAMCEECKLRRKEMLRRPRQMPLENGTLESQTTALTSTMMVAARIPETSDINADPYADQFLENCPTPPPCESDEELDPDNINKLKQSSTSTTTKAPCPPTDKCRKKPTKITTNSIQSTSQSVPPCIPCIPLCSNPCPVQQTRAAPVQSLETSLPVIEPQKGTETTEYYYVYVGLPKT